MSVPTRAKGPAPVFVAGHGNYDRPEWQCEVWRAIVGAVAWVLCPRGIARPDSPSRDDVRFTYPSSGRYLAEVDAGLAALRDRFGASVAEGPIIYVGFSLGAIFGTSFVLRASSKVERAVLVEGGHSAWTADAARKFAQAGGKRVLFACGQTACKNDANKARVALEREKIEVMIVTAPKEGHSYSGKVAELVREQFEWLVAGDPRFSK